MPLMFLISGLFTLSSLERKGSLRFFVDRLQRLGLPFLIASVSVMPLAYWPSRLLAAPQPRPPYWLAFFTSDTWPAGPAWFLWTLLAFSAVFALVYQFMPLVAAKIRHRPTIFIFFLVTVLSYLPLRSSVPVNAWMSLGGPFDVQTSRIGLYFAYFALGTALGSSPQWQIMGWPKHWGYLLLLGVLSYLIHILIPQGGAFTGLSSRLSDMIIGTAFAVSCAGTSLGLLGAFRQFVHKRRSLLDSFTANAYGIYIIHYVFITWLQFLLRPVSWPAWIKFIIVFTLGIGMSWGATMLIRRIPAVRKFL
jgi:surface polysaccharide O-acyltransferase-like enzyme